MRPGLALPTIPRAVAPAEPRAPGERHLTSAARSDSESLLLLLLPCSSATVEFLHVCQELAGGHRRLELGQYQWQVVFALPLGVPRTFRVSSGGDRWAVW